VDHLAGLVAFEAAGGLGPLEIAHPAETFEPPAGAGWRDREFGGELLASPAPTPPRCGLLDDHVA
jgi:hypothetical protein